LTVRDIYFFTFEESITIQLGYLVIFQQEIISDTFNTDRSDVFR